MCQTVDSVTTAFDLYLLGMPTVLVAGGDAFLPGMPSLGSSDGTDWTSALTDAQGSVLRHIDDAGSMSALTRYDTYGGARPSTSLPEGIGFTGEWADATGLVNLRARAYDPSLGAFLSRDAFGGLSTLPLTGNRHAYASGRRWAAKCDEIVVAVANVHRRPRLGAPLDRPHPGLPRAPCGAGGGCGFPPSAARH